MENSINKLPNGDFEVNYNKDKEYDPEFLEWLKENPPFGGPYEFARDREIEEKIANDKRREIEESSRSKGEDKQGSGKRDNYVPFREW